VTSIDRIPVAHLELASRWAHYLALPRTRRIPKEQDDDLAIISEVGRNLVTLFGVCMLHLESQVQQGGSTKSDGYGFQSNGVSERDVSAFDWSNLEAQLKRFINRNFSLPDDPDEVRQLQAASALLAARIQKERTGLVAQFSFESAGLPGVFSPESPTRGVQLVSGSKSSSGKKARKSPRSVEETGEFAREEC